MGVGQTLRHAREEKGLTLDRLSSRTRVRVPILAAIERNDLSGIPPRPYGRAFVKGYAAEVGLDPEQVVRDFFSQFAPPPTPAAPDVSPPRPETRRTLTTREWRGIAYGAGIVGLGALLTIWATQARRPSSPPVGTVSTVGREVPATASTSGTAPATQRSEDLTIVLEATGPSWVTADVDGRRAIYRTLQAGDREVLHGRRTISIRTGDAGALRWTVGNRAAAVMGRPGQVVSKTVTTVAASDETERDGSR
jgi:transcriptional regulator with XRE-family HTH domain